MYLRFYNLREFPFALTSDAKYFYESAVHAEALANMTYTVQQRKGMVLVTGEVGAGKTFVSDVLSARLGVNALVVSIKNPPESKKQLLRGFAKQVGLVTRPSMDKLYLEEALQEYLIKLHHRGRLVGLLIDEAQGLTTATLEEIRMLWNWENEGQHLVQIVLIGQPELRQKLQQPQWEPLRQRIVLSYHLGSLTPEDTAAYIQHRIRIASVDAPQVEFTPDALTLAHQATSGIPRLINVLCDNALLVGYTREQRRLDSSVIHGVIRDMTCWGLRTDVDDMSLPSRSN